MRAAVRLQRLALITVALALSTVVVGWMGVMLAAATFGVLDHRRASAASEAGIAAAIAWGILMALAAGRSFPDAARVLAGAMGLPGAALIVLTLLFPAVLAWSSAAVAQLALTLVRR